MWEIRRYSREAMVEWDEFIEKSRNATFLFKRGYMDYHADRFADHSLLAYRNGRLAALLPANVAGDTLYTHQGLTYGGWIWPPSRLDVGDIFRLWYEWLLYMREKEIKTVLYKPIPFIYPLMPSEEDRYMLFLSKAKLERTDMATVIDLSHNPGFNKLQKRHLKKAARDFFSTRSDCSYPDDIKEFYRLLELCLKERHRAKPVHNLDELQMLMNRFPENIWVWRGINDLTGEVEAGVCIYLSRQTVHCQYIATSANGRLRNSLSALFAEMIDYYTQKGYRYFDFGTSNENGGRNLNTGLNRQKTSYGGSGVAYEMYRINVASSLASLPNELWPPR